MVPKKSEKSRREIVLDSHSLDFKTVSAFARQQSTLAQDSFDDPHSESAFLVRLSPERCQNIMSSAQIFQQSLDQGNVIYGVNTGYGGSADTRTTKVVDLQATLIRELHSGILSTPSSRANISEETCMPETWVRAAMLIRLNSLASGHSGVRLVLVDKMLELLNYDIVPRIPLRGSISASGDLMPLSYVGGALEGKHAISVWHGPPSDRRISTAAQALAEANILPLKLGPKEGLAIINGTAVTTGVAALAIQDCQGLATLSQILTAMSVETLRGATESFDPFFDAVRPHPGQGKASSNIKLLLAESKLVQKSDDSVAGELRQDRYSIRTAPQWLGPVLEDLELACQQVTTECNSVTDNPLIGMQSFDEARILHGGNFQAKAITSAMEKARQGLQTIGQMLFAQCTEILNPKMNNGLPPSLAIDEPSESFLLKPLDIMIAALQSELGFLSNPVGSHVQSAEMGNQSLNSLALISSRYCHTAIEVLSQLAAAHTFALCQALDLRAMKYRFLQNFKASFDKITANAFKGMLGSNATAPVEHRPFTSGKKRTFSEIELSDSSSTLLPPSGLTTSSIHEESNDTDLKLHSSRSSSIRQSQRTRRKRRSFSSKSKHATRFSRTQQPSRVCEQIESLQDILWIALTKKLDQTTTMDSQDRFPSIFDSLQPLIVEFFSHTDPPNLLSAIREWSATASKAALTAFCDNRTAYHASPDATPLLGKGSRHMYNFVRTTLGVPFLSTKMLGRGGGGFPQGTRNDDAKAEEAGEEEGKDDLTTGTLITKLYTAIRDQRIQKEVVETLDLEVME